MKELHVYRGERFTSRFFLGGKEHIQRGSAVLIHGLYENCEVWNGLAERLAERWCVLAVDVLGHNPDARLEMGTNISLYDMACEAYAIARSVGIERSVLVGHSMGGAVAMQWLKHFSESVAGICLFHATPFADTPEARENRAIAIAAIQRGEKDAVIEGLLKRVLPVQAEHTTLSFLPSLRLLLQRVSEGGMIAALEAMRQRDDTSSVLQDCTVPVLLLLGKADSIVPLEPMMHLALKLRRALICLLDGVGHMGMLEAPYECEAAIEGLLRMSYRPEGA
ncbi:MAG: alpha/beta hydrolase [Bacteroidota bacterium]|nr:alpha/beta hydrolase [Candidatus Kapabacteria bacterium]MDW8220985.1 alpha/beta hydrolase [Bacteroidota bacterium]